MNRTLCTDFRLSLYFQDLNDGRRADRLRSARGIDVTRVGDWVFVT
jgi:hypothetical protein